MRGAELESLACASTGFGFDVSFELILLLASAFTKPGKDERAKHDGCWGGCERPQPADWQGVNDRPLASTAPPGVHFGVYCTTLCVCVCLCER